MKKLLLATVATIGLGGVASAADLPVKAPVVFAPVDSWTGLYVGATIGGGLVNATIDDKNASLSDTAESYRKGAVTAGVTAGYNWQFASHGLLGIEGDVNWTNFKASQSSIGWNSALDAKWSWFSTIRARAGIVYDRALFYATGGVAFVDLRANGGNCFHVSSTETGLAAGVGAEYAFGGGWTGKPACRGSMPTTKATGPKTNLPVTPLRPTPTSCALV
jgi:outer membrane immunogenic protein